MDKKELIGLIRESIGSVLLKEDSELGWASKRRDRDDWNLEKIHSGDIGSKAHALYNFLREEGDIDETYDVYDIIPMGEHYDMTLFATKDDLDTQWMVGTEEQTYDSAKDDLKDLVGGEGIENVFSVDFIREHIDMDEFNRFMREFFDESINNDPEGWLDDSDRLLSEKQEMFVKYLELKMEKLQKKMVEVDSEEEQEEISETIQEIEEKIEEINEDPQGEYDYDKIEGVVEQNYVNYANEPEIFFTDTWGEFNLEVLQRNDLIDVDSVIEDAIDTDGPEHTLSRYDGTSDNIRFYDDTYTIIRYN